MKHNKIRNVGIIFEVMSRGISEATVMHRLDEASSLFKIMSKWFVDNPTYLREVYHRVYAPILYTEVNNAYYAGRFLRHLLNEHADIDYERLNKDISRIIKEIDNACDRKKLFNAKLDTYKVFASFNILALTEETLTAEERIHCESAVMEHFVNNNEAEKIENIKSLQFKKRTPEKVQEDRLVHMISMRKFKEHYGSRLTPEGNEFISKFFTAESEKSFRRWAEKKLNVMIETIADKRDEIDDASLVEKVDMANEKLTAINCKEELSTDNMTNIMLGFELLSCLRLY